MVALDWLDFRLSHKNVAVVLLVFAMVKAIFV